MKIDGDIYFEETASNYLCLLYIYQEQQPIEGQGCQLIADLSSLTFHLPTERGERSFDQFKGDVWIDIDFREGKFAHSSPVLSLFLSFSLPVGFCDPNDLIWRKGTPFEAITGRKAPSSDGLLPGFLGFSSQIPGDLYTARRIIS